MNFTNAQSEPMPAATPMRAMNSHTSGNSPKPATFATVPSTHMVPAAMTFAKRRRTRTHTDWRAPDMTKHTPAAKS